MKYMTFSALLLALTCAGHAAPAHHTAAKKPVPHAASAADLAAKAHSDILRAAAHPAGDRPFSDVPPDHWAASVVETLRKREIVTGYPAGPDRPK